MKSMVKSIESGIAMVEQRVNSGRLEVWDCCTAVGREAGEYEYCKDAAGKSTTVPVDGSNHAMDSLRYLVSGMDFGQEYTPADADRAAKAEAEQAARERLGIPDNTPQRMSAEQAERNRRMHLAMWGE
jgi:hypothetical protein